MPSLLHLLTDDDVPWPPVLEDLLLDVIIPELPPLQSLLFCQTIPGVSPGSAPYFFSMTPALSNYIRNIPSTPKEFMDQYKLYQRFHPPKAGLYLPSRFMQLAGVPSRQIVYAAFNYWFLNLPENEEYAKAQRDFFAANR